CSSSSLVSAAGAAGCDTGSRDGVAKAGVSATGALEAAAHVVNSACLGEPWGACVSGVRRPNHRDGCAGAAAGRDAASGAGRPKTSGFAGAAKAVAGGVGRAGSVDAQSTGSR